MLFISNLIIQRKFNFHKKETVFEKGPRNWPFFRINGLVFVTDSNPLGKK